MPADAVLSGGAIGVAILGALGWLARWAWNHTHERIDEYARALAKHEDEDRKRHEEVIRVTTRIDTQMGRFISDMESEKRTRADVNREVFRKLDDINERMPERRHEERKR